LRETNGTDPSSITLVSFLDNTYVTSLYWSATTVTSTGYGDVRAYTVSEKVFAVISMLIGKLKCSTLNVSIYRFG